MYEEISKFDNKIIVANMAQCKECKDVISSEFKDNYVKCSCGNLTIFGGYDFLGREFRTRRWTDLSILERKEQHGENNQNKRSI